MVVLRYSKTCFSKEERYKIMSSSIEINDDNLNKSPEEGRADGGVIENVWNAILTELKHFGSNHVRTLRWIMYF